MRQISGAATADATVASTAANRSATLADPSRSPAAMILWQLHIGRRLRGFATRPGRSCWRRWAFRGRRSWRISAWQIRHGPPASGRWRVRTTQAEWHARPPGSGPTWWSSWRSRRRARPAGQPRSARAAGGRQSTRRLSALSRPAGRQYPLSPGPRSSATT
jgi:hypothetical protein